MRLPKRRKVAWIAIPAVLALLVFGGLLGYWGLQSKAGNAVICNVLEKEASFPKTFVAQGSFRTHNKNLAYVGDILVFELAVIYDDGAHISVGDRALQNFDVSPFSLLDKSGVTSEAYAACSAKKISFLIQAVDVAIAGDNEFYKTTEAGYKERPWVPYSQNGIAKSVSVDYSPLYVAPLTNGAILPLVQSPLEKISVQENGAGKFSHVRLALAAALLAAGLLVALEALSPRKHTGPASVAYDSLRAIFPEMFENEAPHVRLRRLYFNLLILRNDTAYLGVESLLSDLSLRASLVLRPECDKDAEVVLRDIQRALEENRGRFNAIFGSRAQKGGEM